MAASIAALQSALCASTGNLRSAQALFPPIGAPRRRAHRHAARPEALIGVQAPLAELALGGVDGTLLPAAAVGIALAGLAALKLYTYSQTELYTAAALTRHVKKGGARVVQLGGSTRDLFYYPEGTVQVIAAGPDLSISLWEQAGLQARVPVRAVKEAYLRALSSQPGSSADSVALLGALGVLPAAERAQLLREAFRVLKPEGTLVIVQRVSGGGGSVLQALLGGGGAAMDASELQNLPEGLGHPWDFQLVDIALSRLGLLVAVKLAGKGGSGSSGAPASVDAAAFESLMRREQRRRERQAGKQQEQRDGGGGGSKGFR